MLPTFLLLLIAPLPTAQPGTLNQDGADFHGAWRSHGNPREVVCFQADRIARLHDGRLSFLRVLSYDAGGACTHSWATLVRLDVTRMGERLEVTGSAGAGWSGVYERLDEIPAELGLPVLELAPRETVDPDVVAELDEELALRGAEDQRVRRQLSRPPSSNQIDEMSRIDRDNTEFLIEILRELGWIDPARFGSRAHHAAFLIVQHSGHLALMNTVLPFLEAEVQAGQIDGQLFALLYDRFQLNVGGVQRYGSQLGRGGPGSETVLMPLEDPDRVDELRAEMGMGPLANYLAGFDANPVRRFDEILTDGCTLAAPATEASASRR